MKILIFILTIFLFINSIFGQKVNYTADNLAQTGDLFHTLKKHFDSTNSLSINDIDPNKWNFSSVIPETETTIQIYSKDDFIELTDLPNGTMVMQQDNQSYICVNLNGNTLEMLGLLIDLSGNLTPLIFPEPQTMLHFPLTIGESHSSNLIFPIAGTPEEFGFEIPFHDSVRFDISIIASSEIEDTGTVVTHQYSKSAFKVTNTTIFNVDVWAKPSFGGWYLLQENAVADSTRLLQYYNPEYGIPTVEIGLTWNDSILSYKMIDENIQSILTQKTQDYSVYPNPINANQVLYFSQNMTNISFYDVTGRLIKIEKGTYKQIHIPDIPDGYYILKSETPLVTKRIIIK